jgi:hypothetical protein
MQPAEKTTKKEKNMKKLLLIATAALLAAGVTGVVIAEDCVVCWSGTSDIWGTFTMGLTVDQGHWTGFWCNTMAGRCGTIDGTTSDYEENHYEASGTWIETYPGGGDKWQGSWSGTFYFPDPGDTCYGTIVATTVIPGTGTFSGNLDPW